MAKTFACQGCGADLEVPSVASSFLVSPTEGIKFTEKVKTVTCKFCGTTNPVPSEGGNLIIAGDVVARDKIVANVSLERPLWTVELNGPKKYVEDPDDCVANGDHGTKFYWDCGVKRCCYCQEEKR